MAKELKDKEILRNVIDALGVRVPEFRKRLKYNTNTTIYNVFKEVNGISNDMITRITTEYPEVSYLYLKRGVGTPLRVGPAMTNQKNILGIYDKDDFVNIYDFLKLPAVVQELQNKLDDMQKEIDILKKELK